jgi:hypothetical protein
MTSNTVYLYEDNAGGLYIGLDNGPWWAVDGKPGKFVDDAWGLATTDDMDIANAPIDGKFETEPDAKIVAKFEDGQVTLLYDTLVNSAAPGNAATDYMAGDGALYPDTIYATPDGWGRETYYEDLETIAKTVSSLQELGEGWEDVSIQDCTMHSKIKVLAGAAAYWGQWLTGSGRRGGRREVCIFVANGDGTFTLANTLDEEADADQLVEIGVFFPRLTAEELAELNGRGNE